MTSPLRIVLADMAKVHSDGAYTIVHGGIDTWLARDFPAEFAGAFFVEVDAGGLPAGDHDVVIRLGHGPGALKLQTGRIHVADPTAPVRFTLPVTADVRAAQELEFVAEVGPLRAIVRVRVVQEPKPELKPEPTPPSTP